MNILFISPIPSYYKIAKYNHGISALSKMLKQNGYKVLLLSIKCFDELEIKNYLKSFHPDIILISFSSNKRQTVIEICSFFKRNGGYPLILGGVHPTVNPEDCINFPGVKLVCEGDGELPLQTICEHFRDQKADFSKIPNIWWKNGKDIYPPERHWSNRSKRILSDPHIYDLCSEVKNTGRLPFLASIGCLFRCSYCINSLIPRKYQCYPPDSVVNYISNIINAVKEKPGMISFHDDCFPVNLEWLNEFVNLYKKRINIPFYCQIPASLINTSVLKLLAQAGCFEIRIGVETGAELLRKKVLKKNIENTVYLSVFKLIKSFGIRTVALYMIGFPFDSVKSVNDTFIFNKRLTPNASRMSIYQPYPGSKLFLTCKNNGWIKEDTYSDSLYDLIPKHRQIPYLKNTQVLEYFDKFAREFPLSEEA